MIMDFMVIEIWAIIVTYFVKQTLHYLVELRRTLRSSAAERRFESILSVHWNIVKILYNSLASILIRLYKIPPSYDTNHKAQMVNKGRQMTAAKYRSPLLWKTVIFKHVYKKAVVSLGGITACSQQCSYAAETAVFLKTKSFCLNILLQVYLHAYHVNCKSYRGILWNLKFVV